MAKDPFGQRSQILPCAAAALAIAAALLPASPLWAQQGEPVYLDEDALITGKQMRSFSAGGESVNVVVGDFTLTIGKRRLSGRDGVVWIAERRVGPEVLRDIHVYLEGDPGRPAEVVEPDGTITKDRVLLVAVHQRGSLRARVGQHSQEPAETLPVYQRAEALRRGLAPPHPATASAPAPPGPPTRPAPTTTKAAPAPRPYQPVSFRADSTSSQIVPDPRDPQRKIRATVARGHVYVSQGDPRSDLFLEITADAAVIYTELEAEEQLRAELGPPAGAAVAACLEGDVVLRRGERSILGTRLFYDFQNGKALILSPLVRLAQEQRGIPVYVRAKEGRQLGARQGPEGIATRGYSWSFRDAVVTTSDFYTPEFHIAAAKVYLEDTTPYDTEGVALAEKSWRSRLVNTTFNVRGVPLLWWPYTVGDAEEGHTALRRLQVGRDGRFGWGAETEWFLFRLLGLPRPEGFSGRLDADWYERGAMLGTDLRYRRETYSGYGLAYGLLDNKREDDFGTQRQDIAAPYTRGRLLWRHKQFLPRDWELQTELSYLCDKNFLEEFFPGEFWTGKEQETLLYAKKQQDNWALTGLAKWRINDFLTQTESRPELAAYLIGQSLGESGPLKDLLTLYGEGRLGVVRYRAAEENGASSDTVARADVRQEVDVPVSLGPIRLVPYVVGRLTYWNDSPHEGDLTRPWGQVGASTAMHLWRVYRDVKSRLWDLNGIKHVITPYGGVFWSCTSVEPDRLYPFSPEVEQNVRRLGGGLFGVRQLWQTKRGPAGSQHTADWLRLDVYGAVFDDADTLLPADGRYFFYRPEYSLPRNSINGEVTWHVSDSTTFLGDANYDVDSGHLGRADAGISVARDPRLKYYLGMRDIHDLDSAVGTFGASYRINRKYTVSAFEQYDFGLAGGQNVATSATLVRKFPRLYLAFTFTYDRSRNDVGMLISIWPEGIPEARIGTSRLSLLQAAASRD